MKLWIRLTMLTVAIFPATTFGQTVFERGGNVFYRSSDGSEQQITNSGKDFTPSLSADGTEIVFARRIRDRKGGWSDDPGASELWVAEVSQARPATLLFGGKIRIDAIDFEFFSEPRFSPEKEFVYFEIPYSSTSAGIVKLTRATGKTAFIASAINFIVLYSGYWRGFLVALQRQAVFAPDPGIDHWYWLLDMTGQRVGYIGKTDDELRKFLAEQSN